MTWEMKKNAAQVLKATGDDMNDSYEPPRVGSLELAPIALSGGASHRGGGLSIAYRLGPGELFVSV
jgi:hypothetical protein